MRVRRVAHRRLNEGDRITADAGPPCQKLYSELVLPPRAQPVTLRINSNLELPWRELSFRASRSGGPGGQHVNKVSSKVEVRFSVEESKALSESQKSRILKRTPPRFLTKDGEIVVTAEEHRDQSRNRELCLEKLQSLLARALAKPKRRIPTKISRGAKTRRKESRQRHSRKKQERRKRFDQG